MSLRPIGTSPSIFFFNAISSEQNIQKPYLHGSCILFETGNTSVNYNRFKGLTSEEKEIKNKGY